MQAISLIGAECAGDIPAATSEDVDAAVKAAKEAFYRNKGQDWAKATGKHRATFLRAIAKKVRFLKASELLRLGKSSLWNVNACVFSGGFPVHMMVLYRFGQVAERKSELAKLESIDCGKPIDEAEWDMVLLHSFNLLL